MTKKQTKTNLSRLTEYLFYIFVFLLPWQTRWIIKSGKIAGQFWEYGSFSLYATDILLVILLLAYLINGQRHRQLGKMVNKLWPLILAFLFINFISILIAFDKGIAAYGFIKILEAVVLFYLVLRLPISIKKTSLVLVGSASLQVVFSLWQFFAQKVVAFKWLGLSEQLPLESGVYVIENIMGRFLRAYGSLHPIILSYFLTITLIIVLGLYFMAQKRSQELFVYAALYLIVLGLILAFGRVAWLATLVALVLLWMFIWWQLSKRGKRKLTWLTGAVLLGALVFGLVFQDLVITRFQAEERLEQVSFEERAYYIKDASQLIKEHWYEGVGVYNFTEAAKEEISGSREAWNYQPPNNLFILILAETSIFGLFIFLWLIWEIFRIVYQKFKKLDLKKDFWFVIYTIGVILLLITGFFDHTYWTLQFGLLFFWLILGLWARSLDLTDSPE